MEVGKNGAASQFNEDKTKFVAGDCTEATTEFATEDCTEAATAVTGESILSDSLDVEDSGGLLNVTLQLINVIYKILYIKFFRVRKN